MCGSMIGGRATDRWGPTPVLVASVAGLVAVLVTVPLTRDTLAGASVGMAAWGVTAMATQPPQQHRLFAIAPESGPLLLSLNSSATFIGISLGGFIGGRVLPHGGADAVDRLGQFGAALAAVGLLTVVLGARLRTAGPRTDRESAPVPAGDAG
ncbi:hypothetical protein ACWEP4_00670 [Streptomyces sp. NPDC004227]